MRTLTLLNETGDITLSWEEDQDEKMRALIESKLEQGYSFFILEKKFCGLWKKKTELKSIKDLKPEQRTVVLRDADVTDALEDAKDGVYIGKAPEGDFKTTKRSKDVDEIMESDSLAVRPIAAG